MSTMTPTKPKSKKRIRKETTAANASQARPAREAEAPDRGADREQREAPDSGRHRLAEAPDTGDGRQGYQEQEFTHGRSQS